MISVILLTGKKGVGKDEASKYLMQKYAHLNPIRFAYGDRLKDITFQLLQSFYGKDLPIVRQDLDDPVKKEIEYSGYTFRGQTLVLRKVLQYIGTEIFRKQVDYNIWVSIVEKEILEISKHDTCRLIIITDCRFPNEIGGLISSLYKQSNKFEFTTVRILRSTGHLDTHESENSVDNYPTDSTILNNGTLDQFYEKLDRAINIFLIKEPTLSKT